MSSNPISIPYTLKVRGLKKLGTGQEAILDQVSRILDGQLILAEAVGALQTEVRELVTNVEQLSSTLDSIQGDISGLKDAASVKAEADAATISQLRSDLDAAIAAGNVSSADADALRAALATAEESLATAQADFDAGLAPVLAKAQDIDNQTPAVTPPGTPEEPAPPVDENPAPPVEEPAPPVDETPVDPNQPVDGNVEPV